MNDLDIARSYYYEFLAYPLFFEENGDKFSNYKEQLDYLSKSPIVPEDEKNFENLKRFSFDEFKLEQNSVLFDFSYINVPLTASFYDEGRDDGFKRLKVIDILKKSKFRRDDKNFKNSEDFIGFIFLLMALFLKEDPKLAGELFTETVNNFSDEFVELMKEHKNANFFKSYAAILENFIEIERAYYGVAAPILQRSAARESMAKEPYHTRMPTPKSKINWDEFSAL